MDILQPNPKEASHERLRGNRARARSRGSSRARGGRGRKASAASESESEQKSETSGSASQAQLGNHPHRGEDRMVHMTLAMSGEPKGGQEEEGSRGSLDYETAAIEAQVHSALARISRLRAHDGSSTGDADADGDGGGGGGGAAAGIGSEDVEIVVSDTNTEVVKSVEIATRVRCASAGERRARIRVCDGIFKWRGVLPVIAMQRRLNALRPVPVLLHIIGHQSSTSPNTAGTCGDGSSGRVIHAAECGNQVVAQLHGHWLLRSHSLGAMQQISMYIYTCVCVCVCCNV